MKNPVRWLRRGIPVGLAATALLAIAAVHGHGTVSAFTLRWVNGVGPVVPPGTSCATPGYSTIQAAVNASAAGDIIQVCPGIYPEQVAVVGPAKSGLQLISAVPRLATIQAPAVMGGPGEIVTISGALGVLVQGFNIVGPLPDGTICAAPLPGGIGLTLGASATIYNNHITQIVGTTPASAGCPRGYGIVVASGTPASARIQFNQIDNYQRIGVLVEGPGAVADLTTGPYGPGGGHNTIIGTGVAAGVSQFGAVAAFGGTEKGSYDTIIGNGWVQHIGAGVLGFLGGTVQDNQEMVSRNTGGIALLGATATSTLDTNFIFNNAFIGLLMLGTNGTMIGHNTVVGNGLFGIGVLFSTGNTFTSNHAFSHTQFDCADGTNGGTGDFGTDNFWRGNSGNFSTPPPICNGRQNASTGPFASRGLPSIETPELPPIPGK